MLSKHDILNELGKGLCIYPFKESNIKENSINLCSSEFAWTTISHDIFVDEQEKDKNKKFSLKQDNRHNRRIKLEARDSAVIESKGEKYIILLPLSTTLIETQEVLSVSSYIGGTYHSKVGMVSKGLGHIGTMVGPNFSGDSLIAFHNTSSDLIVIKVGESFVSVVFHYLDTPYKPKNPTVSGHTDKFLDLGLNVTEEQLAVLNEDWKKDFEQVRRRMCKSDEYEELKAQLKEQKNEKFKKYFCKKNIIASVITISLLAVLLIIAIIIDNKTGETTWTNRYIEVGCSGIVVTIITWLIKYLKNNAK